MLFNRWSFLRDWAKIQSKRVQVIVFILLCGISVVDAQTSGSTVNIDGSVQYQTVQGLGAQMESHSAYESDSSFWDMFFNDVGVSAVRTGSATIADLASLNSPLMNEEVWPVFRIAKQHGLNLFSAHIHAKPEWKSPAISNGGTLLKAFYDDYANEMVQAISIYENSGGVTVTLNSPIPEPSLGANGDPSSPYFHTYMSPGDYRDFIKVYAPIVKAAKPYVKLYLPLDWNVDGSINYANTILSDPEARKWVDGLATNGYGTESGNTTPAKWQALAALAKQYNIKDIWVPEVSHCCSNQTAEPAGLVMAGWIHNALALGNATIWQMTLGIDKGAYNQNNYVGLVYSKYWPPGQYSTNGITKDGYAFKQYAHWVRPGAIRVNAASSNPEILVSSFLHPIEQSFTAVAINKGTSEATVGFNITNVQGVGLLNVFRTSASENALNVGSVNVVNNFFSYRLPPQSITTFAGSTGTGEVTLSVSPGGAGFASSPGTSPASNAGYAKVAVNSGKTPYGTAVISLKQNGTTVSEAGIPASPPTESARVFIDYRKRVNAVPARSGAGIIDVNTGIAVMNDGSGTANVTYSLRDARGDPVAMGSGSIEAGHHFACFIDQLKNKGVPDFNLPADFGSTIQFGMLDISADQPLSVLALRGTMNQRGEFLITTTPVADLTQAPGYDSVYFPQFVDGGGYTTSLILLNTSGIMETGNLEIRDKDGNPLTVTPVGGTHDSSFRYAIEPGALLRFQTDGFLSNVKAGWVRLVPDTGTPTPVGSGVFGYNPYDVLVSESGIPAANATMHARIYVDLSGNHETGLAIANISTAASNITLNAYQSDGVTPAGISKPPAHFPGYGYTAGFADAFVTGLPVGFTGVLDISSSVPFAALTLRALDNERGDFLMTTFPVADMNQPAPSPIVFPQIVDGGGYTSEFVLIGAAEPSSNTVSFYGEAGNPLQFAK
jgi:O-glycosyl hydrolase